jgi:heat shock protein HtpX
MTTADDRRSDAVPASGHARSSVGDGRALLLIGTAAAYLTVVAYLLLGTPGLLVAVLATLMLALSGPRVPADVMITLYHGQTLAPGQGAGLREIVSTLAGRAELPTTPVLAVVPSLAVGAFAVGGGATRAVLVTEGLLRRHGLHETAAILAHEIAHLKSGDVPVFTLADVTTRLAQVLFYAGVVLALVDAGLWLVGEDPIAPVAVALLLAAPALSSALQLAMPRDHDLASDLLAASLVGDREIVARLAEVEPATCGSPLDDVRLPVPQRRVALPSPLRWHRDGPARAARIRAAHGLPALPPLTVREAPMISLVGAGPIEMRPRARWPGVWF